MDNQKNLDEEELLKIVLDPNVDLDGEEELAWEMRDAIENGADYFHKDE